jgi:molybdate transport system substrate-binding protein
MATRALVAELAAAWRTASGIEVAFESIGGVDAVGRLDKGERYDVAMLDAEALEGLAARGRVLAHSVAPVARSPVAIAVRAGAPRPDVASEAALRRAVLEARSIGHSTGPSGRALLRLFERWGILEAVRPRLVQAAPGVAVASLVAAGEADLGFQQRSEMLGVAGIERLGPMPPGCEIVSVFSAAVCTASANPQAAYAFVGFLRSPQVAGAIRRHGMEPASQETAA